jgi:cell division septum initiation protein DivIVA
MSKWLVERRLSESAERLKRLRAEIHVADEQLRSLTDAADDARLRALMSETPLAEQEHREAQRHADAMARHRSELEDEVRMLLKAQDDLLDRLAQELD